MDHNDILKDLHAQIQESSLVRCADDIQIGDIVYVEMDRNDGLVLVDGYDTRLKYIVVAGSKSDKKEFAVYKAKDNTELYDELNQYVDPSGDGIYYWTIPDWLDVVRHRGAVYLPVIVWEVELVNFLIKKIKRKHSNVRR